MKVLNLSDYSRKELAAIPKHDEWDEGFHTGFLCCMEIIQLLNRKPPNEQFFFLRVWEQEGCITAFLAKRLREHFGL